MCATSAKISNAHLIMSVPIQEMPPYLSCLGQIFEVRTGGHSGPPSFTTPFGMTIEDICKVKVFPSKTSLIGCFGRLIQKVFLVNPDPRCICTKEVDSLADFLIFVFSSFHFPYRFWTGDGFGQINRHDLKGSGPPQVFTDAPLDFLTDIDLLDVQGEMFLCIG